MHQPAPNHRLTTVRPLPFMLLWVWAASVAGVAQGLFSPSISTAAEISIPVAAPKAPPKAAPVRKPSPVRKPAAKAAPRPVRRPVIKAAPKPRRKPVVRRTVPRPAPKPAAKRPAPRPAAKPAVKRTAPRPAPKPVVKRTVPQPASQPVVRPPSPQRPVGNRTAPRPVVRPSLPVAPAVRQPIAPQRPQTPTVQVQPPASRPVTPVQQTAQPVRRPLTTPQPLPSIRIPAQPNARPARNIAAPQPQQPVGKTRPAPSQQGSKVGKTNPQRPYQAPTTVIFSERSTGCQAAFSRREQMKYGFCGTQPARSATSPRPHRRSVTQRPVGNRPVAQHRPRRRAPVATAYPGQTFRRNRRAWSAPAPSVTRSYPPRYPAPRYASRPGGVPSVTPGITPLPNAPAFPGTPYARQQQLKPITGANPLKWLQAHPDRMRFPLALPAQISSAFGWRIHPISQQQKFHAGVDLAAPLGTQVVAAYAGDVLIAGDQGGYGLSILLSHGQGQHATRYAHLSELLVAPGMRVQQGDVIGLVGSTGHSTGPHLHFEALQNTENGLVVVDPSERLNIALVSLVQALHLAKQAEAEQAALALRPALPDSTNAGGNTARASSYDFRLTE